MRTKGMVETNMIERINASQICNQISTDRQSAPAAFNNMAAYMKEQVPTLVRSLSALSTI